MVAKMRSLHKMKPWLKPLLVGTQEEITVSGFLRCRISSIHTMDGQDAEAWMKRDKPPTN